MSHPVKVPIPPDGGWGWVALAGSFLAYFFADGWSYSFGIIFTSFLDHFQQGKGKTAIIAALLYGIPLLISPVVCALTSAYGCRVVAICGGLISGLSFIVSYFAVSVNYLCITLGAFCSIGLAMTYVPAIVIVTSYFEVRRGLATGLAVTGSGVGAFVFPLLLQLLINEFGWRGALLIIGGLYFNVCVAGALFRTPPMGYVSTRDKYDDKNCHELNEININAKDHSDASEICELDKLKDTNSAYTLTASKNKPCTTFSTEIQAILKSMMDKSLASNWPFLLYCASSFIMYMWCGIPYVYLFDKARVHDISYEKASYLLSIIGFGRIVGQILIGILGDVPCINTILLYAGCVIICGLDTLLIPVMETFVAFSVYSAVFGFFISATYSLQMMCIVQITGLEKSINAFGLFQLVQGIATLLGTAIPGKELI